MSIARIFAPDYERYEGVRPVNIYLLRAMYGLMAVAVATNAWGTILRHEGPWDPYRVLAHSVWAIYTTLAILGVFHPLRMLPIVLFMIGYKLLWLVAFAYPLWREGVLTGPAEEIARSFIGVPLAILIVPWKYVWRTYVLGRSPEPAPQKS
jgi:hypothetical protein